MMKFFQSALKLFGNRKEKRKNLTARMRLMFYRDDNECIRYMHRRINHVI